MPWEFNLLLSLSAYPSLLHFSISALTREDHHGVGRAEKNHWRDLWRCRELFQVLAWRDLSVRYKQTIIGVAWALIRPFLTMVVVTVIFGKVAKLPSDIQLSSIH